MENFGKVAPNNLEAEQTVLGTLMIDNTTIERSLNNINPDDFYYLANSEIFDAIRNLFQKKISVDIITVGDELKKRGKLDEVGGLEYLASLTDNILSTKNIGDYFNIIKEKSLLRKLISVAGDLVEKGYSENDEAHKLLDLAESKIFSLNQSGGSTELHPVREVILDVFEQIGERAALKSGITGVDTGFDHLNKMTAGLQRSDLILIAARPAMGKTAFALNVAMNAAKKGNSVALFSLEMSKEQYVQRLISLESLIESTKLRTGNLEDDDWNKLSETMVDMNETSIYIDDAASISLFDLMSKCRRLKSNKGLDVIIIDYLQLMTLGGKAESRQQEISSISRGLKQLARDLNCPVVALSQLSRAVEQRENKRPLLSDLRESGAIEQDADIVMMLYRDEYYLKEESQKKGIAEVIIAKHRNGPIGTVELSFVDRFQKFSDIPVNTGYHSDY